LGALQFATFSQNLANRTAGKFATESCGPQWLWQ